MSFLEFSGCLAPSNGHHQCLLHHYCDIRSRVPLSGLSQLLVVLLCYIVRRLAYSDLELHDPCLNVWEGDVNSLLEPSADGGVQLPGHIARTQHQDAVVVIAHTLHLDQEFCFNSAGGFVLTLTSAAAQGINFIYEYNSRFIFSSEFEQLLDQSL